MNTRNTGNPGNPGNIGLLLACLLAGCGADRAKDPGSLDGGSDASSPGALVVLGTGDATYQAITDDQPLPLHEGIQGGHHFFVHARMRGLEPGEPATPGLASNPATSFRAYDDSGERIDDASPPALIGYYDAGDGFYELPSPRFLFIQEARVAGLAGKRALLQVDVMDSEGRSAHDQVWIWPYEVPLEPSGAAVPAARASVTKARRAF